MYGYKVFFWDWTCREFQYEVGKTARMDGVPKICQEGFHFCKELHTCFEYYPLEERYRIAIVESRGAVVGDGSGKFCTNALRIIKEVSWDEAVEIAYKEITENYAFPVFVIDYWHDLSLWHRAIQYFKEKEGDD